MFARGVRNVIYNYTDAQRKVRSATSNDAWGPSPALMHEIADLTDNVVAYAEIMPIIWKRLNDHGKNWRHVYKSLVLLDHLIRYGNERVNQQCKENIFAIQTLKDFQYVEDQKDQGFNVREKAKQLVALLKDDERLRNERRKAQEARERYARQAMGMDSHGAVTYGRPSTTASVRRNSAEGGDNYNGSSHPYTSASTTHRSSSLSGDLYAASSKDFVQPTNQEEEQLQMQIALAESQREAEDEERRRRNDELKLKIALERSVNEKSPDILTTHVPDSHGPSYHLDPPFLDTNQQRNDPYSASTSTKSGFGWNPPSVRPSSQHGFTAVTNDPWSSEVDTNSFAVAPAANNDPWQIAPSSSTTQSNPWGGINSSATNNNAGLSVNLGDPWNVGTTDSQSKTNLPTIATTNKTINNELSEFFGATTSTSTPFDHHQQTSSNPWNMPSTTFPTTSNNTSQANNGFNTGGNLLYPTIAGTNSSKSNTSSPVPSALSTSRKTPESFLGDDFGNLVNLDKLVSDPKSTNPFVSTAPRAQNPFANLTKPPTLEQLSSSNNAGFTTGSTLPPPLIPSSINTNISSINTNNPFM